MPHYDYDKDYPFAAFITNLGKYNEGALVGEWVKFPTTAEELKKVFERIGIGAKDDFGQTYEEWFITDYDCYVDGLYDLLGEYANLDELNYLASKLDDMSQDEYERFQAAMEIGDHTGSIQELINLTENLDCYDITPTSTTTTIWGGITSRNWMPCRCRSICATTSTMRPTGGTSPWRKAASSPTLAMCGTPGTASMSITMASVAASRRNTG